MNADAERGTSATEDAGARPDSADRGRGQGNGACDGACDADEALEGELQGRTCSETASRIQALGDITNRISRPTVQSKSRRKRRRSALSAFQITPPPPTTASEQVESTRPRRMIKRWARSDYFFYVKTGKRVRDEDIPTHFKPTFQRRPTAGVPNVSDPRGQSAGHFIGYI